MKNQTYIGVDLGTVNDFTAIAILERYGEMTPHGLQGDLRWTFKAYRLLHLDRYLGEPYTRIVERILTLLERPELRGSEVIVDATGVGRPVVDLLMDQGLTSLVPVTITGGDSVTTDIVRGLRELRVPKRDLVGTLQVVLQGRQLKIPATIPLREELTTELQNFKVKLNAESGHATYEHWRSSDHDDLVLSLALPLWYGEHQRACKTGFALMYI